MGINIQKNMNRIRTDRVCDYIPVVSGITNLIDLFQKIHYRNEPKIQPINEAFPRYSIYIRQKSIGRCIALFLPFLGNLFVRIHDLRKKSQAEKLFQSGQDKNPHEGVKEVSDVPGALADYTKAAKLGHVGAMLALGKLYKAEKNSDLSMAWYERAAFHGNAEAKVAVANAEVEKAVGKDAETPANLAEAAKILEEAATNQNDRTAQFNMAMMYYEGKGVAQDHQKAFEYFKLAATPPPAPLNDQGLGARPKGNPHARYMLGLMYAKGEGTPRSGPQASAIAYELTNENYPYGFYLLGYLHEKGINAPVNRDAAIKNYLIAKENGVAIALEALEDLKVDVEKAAEEAKKAADPDGLIAQYQLGFEFYKAGNYPVALKVFKEILKKTNNNHRPALYMAGMICAHDAKGPQALKIAKKLIKSNDPKGNYLMGYLYEKGIGVAASAAQSKKQYQIASRSGVQEAKEALARLRKA